MRSRVLRGVAWKVASQVVLQLSRSAVALVLARLLAPHDYGLAAMVLVFSSLVLIFTDLALGAALVQRPTLSEADRSTVFWTSLGAGVLFTLVGIALSGPIAGFYGEPEVKPLFAALSLSFVIAALGTTQRALLTREMSFRALELRMMVATLAGAALGILVALQGFGAWAIIVQQLTVASVSSVVLWFASPWHPKFTYSLASLRELGGFSANVFGTRTLFYLNRNTDNLLIGRFLGPAALGAYALAYNVMLFPFSRIAGPIQEVLFPALSRMQHDRARMAAVWIRVNRLVGAIAIPALLGLVVVAPDFVDVVLGRRWAAATPVIQILAWVGLLQSLQRLNSSVLMALDRTRTLVRYSFVALAASLVAFVCGLPFGIVGVAAAYAIASTFIEPYYTWLTARALEISPADYLRSVSGIVQSASVMVVCVLGVRVLLVHEGVPPLLRLAVSVVVGGIVFVPLCSWRAPEIRKELTTFRRRRRNPVARAQAAEA